MKLACAVDEIGKLTPDEMKAILDRDEKGEFFLLDVRQPEECRAGHIPGAMLIPLGELEARQGELDRGKKIIVYKYRPRKRYRRKQGHRQYYTRLRIDDIITGSKRRSKKSEEEEDGS